MIDGQPNHHLRDDESQPSGVDDRDRFSVTDERSVSSSQETTRRIGDSAMGNPKTSRLYEKDKVLKEQLARTEHREMVEKIVLLAEAKGWIRQ
jgi:hypothetical protein